MSRDKKVGEVVSAIISLVNSQFSCLVQLLGHRQSTEILESIFLTFYFSSVSKNIFCFNVFQASLFYYTILYYTILYYTILHFTILYLTNLIYFSINFMLTTSIQHESTGLIGKLICNLY